jgi:hypothetical protein
MLLACANLFWRDERTGGEPFECDGAGVARALGNALAAAARAERVFRGERWGHPGALCLDVLDAAKQFRARGCDDAGLQDVQRHAEAAATRLSTSGANVLGAAAPRPCWSEELEARREAILACSDEPLHEP